MSLFLPKKRNYRMASVLYYEASNRGFDRNLKGALGMKWEGEREFFYCYSHALLNYLKRKGVRYICTGLHPESKHQFFLFRQTPRLSELLTQYDGR